MLELEIKRGSAEEALDAIRLADGACLQEEDRKVYRIPYTIYIYIVYIGVGWEGG